MSYKIIAKYSNDLASYPNGWKLQHSFNLIFERDFNLEYFKSQIFFESLRIFLSWNSLQ